MAPKPLVLLVNDDEPSRRLLKMAVRGAGWRCGEAPDAESAWSTLGEMGADALVVDLSMSNEGGLKFLGKLRASGVRQPIVYLTGNPVHELDLVHEAGTFTALLRKPVDLDHFVNVLREGLAESGPPANQVA